MSNCQVQKYVQNNISHKENSDEYLHVIVTVGQEGESSSGGLVGVVDVGEDVDGLGEPLLLDQTVDGAGVLPILDIKLVVHDVSCYTSDNIIIKNFLWIMECSDYLEKAVINHTTLHHYSSVLQYHPLLR